MTKSKIITVKPKESNASQSNRQVSKTLEIFFILLQTIFAYDFGFTRNKAKHVRIAVKILSALLPVTLGVVLYLMIRIRNDSILFGVWYSSYVLNSFAYIVILNITPERKTFLKFLERLLSIDTQLQANSSYCSELKIVVYCTLSCLYKIVVTAIYCTFPQTCLKNMVLQSMYTAGLLGLDIPPLMFCFVFYVTRIRLESLRKCINEKKINANRGQILYKSLLDTVEDVKTSFDVIFFASLLINIPTMMTMMYTTLRSIKYGLIGFYQYAIEVLTALTLVLTIVAPAISAGSLSTEVNRIRVILQDMLLVEADNEKIKIIKRFINYVEARPFKFRVYKIIPLDVTFPFILLNLSITYLIVILQLTRIY